MKKIILGLVLVSTLFGVTGKVYADGCYMCNGGESFVKYSGDDNQDKRKAAAECGCKVTGTRGDCSAANLKVLCSVKADVNDPYKIAQILSQTMKKN